MTDPVVIGGVLVLVIGAIGTTAVNIIVALQSKTKMNEVAETTKVIEKHVNSAAERAAAEIASLRQQLAAALIMAAERKETAALLAQSLVQNKE